MHDLPEIPPSRFSRAIQAALVVVAALSFDFVLTFFAVVVQLEAYLPAGFADVAALGIHVLAALFSIFGIWKRLPLRWVVSAIGLNGCFLLWLAHDEPAPPPPPSLGPVLAADSRQSQVYGWLLKGSVQLKESPQPRTELPAIPGGFAERAAAVQQHRAAWEAAIAENTLGRSWLEAMAESAPEGVYAYEGLAKPLLDFSRSRRAVQCEWARAELLRADGKADEAAGVLLTVLRTSYNLQRAGSALVTQMIATVFTKGTYERLDLLLADGAVSPAMKARIQQTLAQAPRVEAALALAFASEQFYVQSAWQQTPLDHSTDDWASLGIHLSQLAFNRILVPVLLNPNRSKREQGELLTAVARLSQSHPDGTQPFAREWTQKNKRIAIKNPVGHRLMMGTVPAFDKVIAAFWAADDLRVALLKKLAAGRP